MPNPKTTINTILEDFEKLQRRGMSLKICLTHALRLYSEAIIMEDKSDTWHHCCEEIKRLDKEFWEENKSPFNNPHNCSFCGLPKKGDARCMCD